MGNVTTSTNAFNNCAKTWSGPAAVLASRLADRLDAVLIIMGYCKGAVCRNPWAALHPNGSVNSLAVSHRGRDGWGGGAVALAPGRGGCSAASGRGGA